MPGKTLAELLKENPNPTELSNYFKDLLESEILISFFNNKGGVGKSSSCAELGAILAKNGCKVLVVDADAQGSVSSRILHREFIKIGKDHYPDETDSQILADIGEDYVREHHTENELIDIHAFFSSVNRRPANPQELNNSVNRVKLFQAPLNSKPEKGGELWVLLGALQLEELDTTIVASLALGTTFSHANVSVPGALPMALRCLARAQEFDVVLIDLNPAPSALNQCLLMGSTYYSVPYTADFSSSRAVKNITHIIPKWSSEIAAKNLRLSGLTNSDLHPVGCFPSPPTLLSAICQRVPAKIPNAYQRARATIVQKLVELSQAQHTQSQQLDSIVSFVISEGSSTAVAAGLDGTALSDITKEAAARIHKSKEGQTISAAQHRRTGEKIAAEYYFALSGMIAAMNPQHQQKLNADQFRNYFEENANKDMVPQFPPQSQNKKRKLGDIQPPSSVILTSADNTLRYRRENVVGDGDCALNAVNVTREEFCQGLRNIFFTREGVFRVEARQRARTIIQEMYDILTTPDEFNRFPQNIRDLWTPINTRLEERRQEVGRARARWIEILPTDALKLKAQQIHKEDDFYKDLELAAFAATKPEIRNFLLTWTQCIQQENQSKVEIGNTLASAPLLNAFINYYTEPKRWVGIQTLILYAKVTQAFSLYIHRIENGHVTPARERERHIQAIGPVIHIVYNGTNHFDRLIELPAQPNEPAQATMLNNPINPAARRLQLPKSIIPVPETPKKKN